LAAGLVSSAIRGSLIAPLPANRKDGGAHVA
jgi:hypothetical protein